MRKVLGTGSVKATITKIRAMHGKMLTPSDYKILASKKSVSEVCEYLKSHRKFAGLLSDIDVNTVRRGYLEQLIRKYNFDTFIKLRDFQHLKNEEFYNTLSLRYETEQLLALISSIFSGRKDEFIAGFPPYLIGKTKLDFPELSQSTSIAELAKKLDGTAYKKPMEQIMQIGEGIDYLGCEIILRAHYYKRVLKSIKTDLPKADSEPISKALRSEIDIRNIVNAYRMKAYFDAGQSQIKDILLPFGRMGRARTDALCECPTAQDMQDFLSVNYPAATVLFEKGDFIETQMAEINLKSAKKLLRTQSMPSVYFAFLRLCENEADNIIHIIEGIRYELPPEKTEELLAY